MHIEPGVVNEAKMVLSYATAAGVTALTIKSAARTLSQSKSAAFISRFILATLLTLFFFEVLPKFPVASPFYIWFTLFLLFEQSCSHWTGCRPAIQGLIVAPADLPQYFMNTTTLLFPLYGFHGLRDGLSRQTQPTRIAPTRRC